MKKMTITIISTALAMTGAIGMWAANVNKSYATQQMEENYLPKAHIGSVTFYGSDALNLPEFRWIKDTIDNDEFEETSSESFDKYNETRVRWMPAHRWDGTNGLWLIIDQTNDHEGFFEWQSTTCSWYYYG